MSFVEKVKLASKNLENQNIFLKDTSEGQTIHNCQNDICPGNICSGAICPILSNTEITVRIWTIIRS